MKSKSSHFPPVIILCEPQMGENIGASARAMANFGLEELRLVTPRDGWPNEKAFSNAGHAKHILDSVKVFQTTEDAVKDLHYVYATTARSRNLAKPVLGPVQCAKQCLAAEHFHHKSGILFGRERWGLNNDEIGQSDAIVTLPVVEQFASLNIAQAVMVLAYEWRKQSLEEDDWVPFQAPEKSAPATKSEINGFFEHLEGALDDIEFYKPLEKKPVMVQNIRALFHRAQLTQQDVRTLRGIVRAFIRGKRE
jgi:tRNA/rRNA methyltransferase